MKHIISEEDVFDCVECDFINTTKQGPKLRRTTKHENIDSRINREDPAIEGHLRPIFHDTSKKFQIIMMLILKVQKLIQTIVK
jgi:hypothetical protein